MEYAAEMVEGRSGVAHWGRHMEAEGDEEAAERQTTEGGGGEDTGILQAGVGAGAGATAGAGAVGTGSGVGTARREGGGAVEHTCAGTG